MEVTLKSYDPLAYRINNVFDFDPSVVKAFKNKDQNILNAKLVLSDKKDFKIFICVNKEYHAFVLCIESIDNANKEEISELLTVVTRIELCFEDVKARMYKIRWKKELFINIKDTIKKAYDVGIFMDISDVSIQCAALGASPDTYRVLIDDCVEFSKRFCKELLKYASNGTSIQTQVQSQIRSATASGFSAEQLSREIQSSAYSVNTFLGGLDVSSFLFSWKGKVLIIFLFVVYPFIVHWLMTRMN